MPTVDFWPMIQDALSRALQRQFGVQQPAGKRPRRAVPYSEELLAKAASRGVNYGRIRAAKKH